ncbi:hypothetical protein NUH87_29195 [Pseudomonas batumici]|uniref:hypothetical protein n=1 Tax=Pseudomonas batumici TaxID=226910 RepID=UPI0030CBBB44
MKKKTGLCTLVTALLLAGCTHQSVYLSLNDGMEYSYTVAYPIRGPEYVLSDLGGERYLLAQQSLDYRGQVSKNIRYFDRRTGVLTPMGPLFLNSGDNIPIRYSSDDPQVVAFLQYGVSRDLKKECLRGSTLEERLQTHCYYIRVELSMDGGKSFGLRHVEIPSVLNAGSGENNFAFAAVRNHVLYIGLKAYNDDSQQAKVALRRLLTRPGFYGVILAAPLPPQGSGPAQRINNPHLVADRLTGKELEDFVVEPAHNTLRAVPKSLDLQYGIAIHASERRKYVDELRASYPEWAKQQRLDIPEEAQEENRDEREKRAAAIPAWRDDPIEWIRFGEGS